MKRTFKKNKKLFYNEVNSERRVKEKMEMKVKDGNKSNLTEG